MRRRWYRDTGITLSSSPETGGQVQVAHDDAVGVFGNELATLLLPFGFGLNIERSFHQIRVYWCVRVNAPGQFWHGEHVYDTLCLECWDELNEETAARIAREILKAAALKIWYVPPPAEEFDHRPNETIPEDYST